MQYSFNELHPVRKMRFLHSFRRAASLKSPRLMESQRTIFERVEWSLRTPVPSSFYTLLAEQQPVGRWVELKQEPVSPSSD